MKKKSLTDWKRIDAMPDEAIDTSDIGKVDFSHAELRMPENKNLIAIRLDADVLKWLKSQGRGYQTRINAILRTYMETVKEKRV